MTIVSVTELKNNLSKYIKISRTEDVYITKRKEIVATLTCPQEYKKKK